MMEIDFSHLNALQHRLFNEQQRLASEPSPYGRELLNVWIAQIEREIAAEYKHLGMTPPADVDTDELLAELMA